MSSSWGVAVRIACCVLAVVCPVGANADQAMSSDGWDCTANAENAVAPRWSCVPGKPGSGAVARTSRDVQRGVESAPADSVSGVVDGPTGRGGYTAGASATGPDPIQRQTSPEAATIDAGGRVARPAAAEITLAQQTQPDLSWELSEPPAQARSVAPVRDAAAEDPVAEGYRVQPGDLLEISVWGETELNREVLVRPDGNISFPLVGEVEARGQPVAWIDAEISRRLERFIPAPEVTVAVRQVIGNSVFVVGKVNRPGQIVATRQLDVMQALGIAGGLTRFADGDEIKIVRRVDGVQQALPFRYSDIEKGENLELNILLQPGDLVVVP